MLVLGHLWILHIYSNVTPMNCWGQEKKEQLSVATVPTTSTIVGLFYIPNSVLLILHRGLSLVTSLYIVLLYIVYTSLYIRSFIVLLYMVYHNLSIWKCGRIYNLVKLCAYRLLCNLHYFTVTSVIQWVKLKKLGNNLFSLA